MQLRTVFDDLVRFETELWNAADARLLRETGISLGVLNVLLVVDATEACRVNDIAEKLSITVGGASQAVDRIVKQGLCERSQHPTDRRSSIVELTPAGTDALGRGGPVFDAELALWLGAVVPDAAFATFAATLSSLRSAAVQRQVTST